MNSLNFLSLVLVTVFAVACAPKTLPLEEEIVTTETNPGAEKEKFKPAKNAVSISPLVGNYTVKIGQQVYYVADVHGSVGSTATAYSKDETVLAFQSNILQYNDEKAAEMPGGDAASLYFVFDPVKVGTSDVIVTEMFRGEVKNEYTITITVVEN